ncbi:NUDIX domain-containing protein [Uliginosibacterium sp. H3]|uniref:NUDIX domain-containing protein n=1 Tax=Uliginosibacterium silvisoli TaxID=3114758 RepID=A0ABU6K1X6_9RHOO|nr:NUDIX domain-containing protein [Uliginosibacterium sp. H3]
MNQARQRFALSVSVFVIVRDGPQVLLLRRANTGWKDGFLSLPAGAHDGAETLAQAAVRELREETGISAAEADMRLVHLMHCRAGDTGGEWLGAFFVAENWSGTPALLEAGKHDHIAWYAIDALPENLIPYTRQGIECSGRGEAFSSFGWTE